MNIAFDARGLAPAIVQSAVDGRVLMLGWMNQEAVERTHGTGRVTFYSRSRQAMWEKGETSGNWLEFVDLRQDCDADALLVRAIPHGPTCHTGTASCFGVSNGPGDPLGNVLARLNDVVRRRDEGRPEDSYTARLLESGTARIAQKVGEEGLEVALAAVGAEMSAVTEESADLLYHLLVLWRAVGVEPDAVADALRARAR